MSFAQAATDLKMSIIVNVSIKHIKQICSCKFVKLE